MRRQKTYSAQSGYVYQYFFEGYRPAGQAMEYVFDVTADRKTSFPVSIFIPAAGVTAWERVHQRSLNTTECYAIAKMALFQAFDNRAMPEDMRQPVHVDDDAMAAILETLSID